MPSAEGTITFVNASVFDASVYVLDENGNETFIVDLSPDQSSKQATVAGQVWIVKDKDTGRQVGTATGKAGDQTYEIKFRRSRGEPEQTRGGGG
ncbi:hypothetical protein L0337_26335 [candidate division KSB1 bacterium]|nr:hypothetical protein [candidate division KSB1 bacterium]